MGAGLALGLVGWALGMPSYQAFLLALVVGFGREIAQHLDRPLPILNLHNVGEALSWGAGAGLVGFVRIWM